MAQRPNKPCLTLLKIPFATTHLRKDDPNFRKDDDPPLLFRFGYFLYWDHNLYGDHNLRNREGRHQCKSYVTVQSYGAMYYTQLDSPIYPRT